MEYIMKRIQLNKDIHPLSDFRANAATLISQVRKTKRPMVITQNGKSSVVILDVDEYESLVEKNEILMDLRTAENQIDSGLGIKHEIAKTQALSNLQKTR